jgi:hypothetical protein
MRVTALYAPRVVARVLLAFTAVLVLAWVGVLLRNYHVGHDAAIRAFFGPEPTSSEEREHLLKRLDNAEALDPSSYWQLARANLYLFDGDARQAQATAEDLVRAEPENPFAWGMLREATEQRDPARAAQANAELRRLNPLGSR